MVSFSERLQEYERNLARRSRHLSLSAYLTASSCNSELIPENGSAEWQVLTWILCYAGLVLVFIGTHLL